MWGEHMHHGEGCLQLSLWSEQLLGDVRLVGACKIAVACKVEQLI